VADLRPEVRERITHLAETEEDAARPFAIVAAGSSIPVAREAAARLAAIRLDTASALRALAAPSLSDAPATKGTP
jgi:hypothetical protein